MTTRNSLYILLLFLCFILFSCNYNNDANINTPIASAKEKPDSIKSCIIYMKSVSPVNGSDVERTIYFDDYGARKRTVSIARLKVDDRQQVSTTQITIDADGYSSHFDPDKKSGYKTRISKTLNPSQINFGSVDQQTMQMFGIKKEGTEVVAGKECDVYTLEYPSMNNFRGRYAVWNNIPLHETSTTSEFGYEYKAYKIDENVEIQPIMFVVPDSVKLTETASYVDSLRSSYHKDSVLKK